MNGYTWSCIIYQFISLNIHWTLTRKISRSMAVTPKSVLILLAYFTPSIWMFPISRCAFCRVINPLCANVIDLVSGPLQYASLKAGTSALLEEAIALPESKLQRLERYVIRGSHHSSSRPQHRGGLLRIIFPSNNHSYNLILPETYGINA